MCGFYKAAIQYLEWNFKEFWIILRSVSQPSRLTITFYLSLGIQLEFSWSLGCLLYLSRLDSLRPGSCCGFERELNWLKNLLSVSFLNAYFVLFYSYRCFVYMYVYAIHVYRVFLEVGRGHWSLCILLYTNVAEKAMIKGSLFEFRI